VDVQIQKNVAEAQVARIRENSYWVLVRNLWERGHLEDVDERIILKWIIRK
jgi:hypothetical protein